MFEAIGEFWTQNAIGSKIYIGYASLVCIIAISYIIGNLRSNPRKKIDFIVNATQNGCLTVGKMTCLTLNGSDGPSNYHAEYMYVVDGKRYFVTYEMCHNIPIDARKEEMNADMLLLKLKPALIFFYDKKNPKKALSKLEVFTSHEGIHQIPTPKKNVWRDIDKDWDQAIDLVHY
jgi:hypothetical protein